MAIRYHTSTPVTRDAFISLLRRSTLAQRRPVDDKSCIEGMLANSNLLISAWDEGDNSAQVPLLVGLARSMTDFHYACYLSDLAVDERWQSQGIGKRLLKMTQQALEPSCKLILIAAPAADSYYAKLGLERNPRCWTLEPSYANNV